MKLEFFIDPHSPGDTVVHDMDNDRYKKLTEKDAELIDRIYNRIRDSYPKALERLKKLYNSRLSIVNRFLRCNFSIHDNRFDIDDDFNFEFECVLCPLKGGLCKDEGVICNPELTDKLSNREIQVASMLAYGTEKTEVADRLFISVFTVENHRKNIYHKLGIHRAQELTLIACQRKWIE